MCSGLPQSKVLSLGMDSPSVGLISGADHDALAISITPLSRLLPRAGFLTFAKHLLLAATTVCHGSLWCSSQPSLMGHLNRGVDGVFETVRVVNRGLASIAEVHAIVPRAHLAQSEPEMARD